MKNATTRNANDNNDPWQTLAAATAKVLNPNEKHQKSAASESNGSGRDEQKRDTHEEYVDKRLSELAAFERRARGQR